MATADLGDLMTIALTLRVHDVLADGGVRTVFQPIVDLATGETLAHEAISRGPEGPLESPGALFGAAAEAGLLA